MIKTALLSFLIMLTMVACDQPSSAAQKSPNQMTIVTAGGKRHDFKIELALTPIQQQNGLMYRTEMAADAGMLFYFSEEAPRAFWMKNTLIPLDMIFIKKDGRILNIHENAIPNDLTSIPSDGPVVAVVELNGGITRKLGIKAGDKIDHILFPN